VLDFHNIHWPEDQRDPEVIEADALATYYCARPDCGEEILNHLKAAMVATVKWVSDKYQSIDPATGEVTGEINPAHRGFWINCLYSPFLSWSDIAAEWLRSQGTPAKLQNFKNSWLAEVWKDQAVASSEDALAALKTTTPPEVVPAGFVALTAGVDMQKDSFRFCVYAWRWDLQSHLVAYGVLSNWADVVRVMSVHYHNKAESD
jgi:phage terminase large subunit GpA-like protein